MVSLVSTYPPTSYLYYSVAPLLPYRSPVLVVVASLFIIILSTSYFRVRHGYLCDGPQKRREEKPKERMKKERRMEGRKIEGQEDTEEWI